jgi:pyruvate-formate lyase
MNIILQYESNASSISLGRFDQYMLPFYQASLNRGQDPRFSGAAGVAVGEVQRYRPAALLQQRATSRASDRLYRPARRPDETGRSAVNVLSFLCLDAYQNVRLPQPNLGVRVNELIDRPFLRKTAETIRLGTGIRKFSTMKWWSRPFSTAASRWKMRGITRWSAASSCRSRAHLRPARYRHVQPAEGDGNRDAGKRR